MTVSQDQIRIRAQLSEVARVRHVVGEAALRAGLDEKARHHCQLAVDEACTNIIEHGFAGGQPAGWIEVICSWEPGVFRIFLSDNSPPYNPLEHIEPDPQAGLAERQGGGWGVYFIRTLMDDVGYAHTGGHNHLTLVKYLLSAGRKPHD
jgi:serine/threonine-protein kinase RsbW